MVELEEFDEDETADDDAEVDELVTVEPSAPVLPSNGILEKSQRARTRVPKKTTLVG